MLVYLLILLFLGACVQGMMIKFKHLSNEDKTLELKAQELTEYLDTGYARSFDGDGCNILMLAAMENAPVMLPVMEKALAYGLAVNGKSKRRGNTALHYACGASYGTKGISFLLSREADPNSTNKEARTPFWNLCFVGNNDGVKMMLPKVNDLNQREMELGYTPLMIAAREGRIAIVHELLDNGADAKLVCKSGETAYEIAKANLKRHYKHNPNSASSDESYARHNHGLDEMVRRLYCVMNGDVFKPQKYRSSASFSGVEPDMDE